MRKSIQLEKVACFKNFHKLYPFLFLLRSLFFAKLYRWQIFFTIHRHLECLAINPPFLTPVLSSPFFYIQPIHIQAATQKISPNLSPLQDFNFVLRQISNWLRGRPRTGRRQKIVREKTSRSSAGGHFESARWEKKKEYKGSNQSDGIQRDRRPSGRPFWTSAHVTTDSRNRPPTPPPSAPYPSIPPCVSDQIHGEPSALHWLGKDDEAVVGDPHLDGLDGGQDGPGGVGWVMVNLQIQELLSSRIMLVNLSPLFKRKNWFDLLMPNR